MGNEAKKPAADAAGQDQDHSRKATDFAIKAGGSVAGGVLIGEAIGGPVGAFVGGVIGAGAAALSTFGKGSSGSHG